MMKNKRAVLMLVATCLTVSTYAQQYETRLYQQTAGDYAGLYQGHLEDELVQRVWANHPYLDTSEFRPGSISYAGVVYEDVPIRYDAHAQYVVVMTPVRNAKVVPDQKQVEWFTLDGDRFVPNVARGGFSRQVHAGEKASLLDHRYKTVGARTEEMGKLYRTFNSRQQYYVMAGGVQAPVSSFAQLVGLFPEYRQDLQRYRREHHLKFSAGQRESSLSGCIRYLNTLIP